MRAAGINVFIVPGNPAGFVDPEHQFIFIAVCEVDVIVEYITVDPVLDDLSILFPVFVVFRSAAGIFDLLGISFPVMGDGIHVGHSEMEELATIVPASIIEVFGIYPAPALFRVKGGLGVFITDGVGRGLIGNANQDNSGKVQRIFRHQLTGFTVNQF